VLIDQGFPAAEQKTQDVQQAAVSLAVRAALFKPQSVSDFERIFIELSRQRADALLVCASPFFNNHRDRLAALAARADEVIE